jgi:hypothetical protein
MKKYYLSALFMAMAGVALAQPCNVNVVASYNNPVCSGKDLNLTATSVSGASYEWQGPSSYVSFVRNSTLSNTTLQSSGDYIVTVTAGACVYRDTVTVEIHSLPSQPILSTIIPPCEGDSLLLRAMSTGSSSISYQFWDPMGNPFQGSGNISSAINGIYSCVAKNTMGCVSDTGKLNVTVKATPSTPTMTLLKTPCSGDTLKLGASASGGVSSFLFFDQGGHQVASTITNISYLNTGIYKCVVIGISGCSSDSADLSVLVHQTIKPGVAIYGDVDHTGPFGTVMFTSLVSKAGFNPQYQWLRNGNPILNANAPSYTAISGVNIMPGDLISLRVTSDAVICPGTSQSNDLTISVNTDVNDIDKAGGFVIYPNPSNGIIHIKTNINEGYKVEILNAIGSVVYTAQGKGEMRIDVTGKIPAGNYIIRMSANNQSISRKLNITQ